MRHFGRALSDESGRCDRYRTGLETVWTITDDSGAIDPVEDIGDREAECVLQAVLDDLCPRERDILTRRYGLADDEPQTLREVSDSVNLSRERVRQIEKQALSKLRGELDRRGVSAAILV
jgi:RNA polymerase sigma factor (sigma-70 family)